LANLSVNLHVCLYGGLQDASTQTLDFLDIGQKFSFPDWKPGSTGKSFRMDTTWPRAPRWMHRPHIYRKSGGMARLF